MIPGRGKYDDACTQARDLTKALGVVLIVIEGEHGSGVSVQTLAPDLALRLPALLEQVAQEIRADTERWTN